MFVAHKVILDQREIDPKTGKPRPVQAARHEVFLWTMDLNVTTRLGILRWLDVRARLPLRFVHVEAKFRGDSGEILEGYQSIHHRNETLVGIGDPELQFGFRPVSFSRKQPILFEFGVGLSFPLGRTEPDPYAAGREGREHQHIMFGSGTFDPMGFLTLGYIGPLFQIYANFFARGALYKNHYGFQRGPQIKGSTSFESGFGLKTWSFQLQVALMRQWAGLWNGIVDPDSASGRTDLLVGMAVFWRPNASWQVYLRADAPINLYVEGGELTHPVIFGLGFNYQFRIFK